MLVSSPASGSRLAAVSAAQPPGVVSAADLGRAFGKGADWITVRTGIEQVRRAEGNADVRDLAERAAGRAVRAAGLLPADIDLVLTASCSLGEAARPVEVTPRRSAPRAAVMHLNAACSGFGHALQTADALIRQGAARHVLVVAAERMSSLLDGADLGTSILFGDGAGAAVVSAVDSGGPGIGPTVFGSDGGAADVLRCDDAGLLRMAGREVFRWAVETVPPLARRACERAGVLLSDIAAFVPHQANLRIVDAATKALGLSHAVVADDVRLSGNTSAASIPIAMTRLLQAGRATAGDLALLVGFGAGLSFVAQVVELPVCADGL